LSRVDPLLASQVEVLQGKKLFGEIPVLTGVQSKPQRLTDQIDMIKEKAYQDGYRSGIENGLQAGKAEGYKQGLLQAQVQVKAERDKEATLFFADWEDLRNEFETAAAEWFVKTEEVVTELAMQAVRRILASELETNPQTALGICKDVLKQVTHAKHARILINPSDYALFESHREELVKQSRELKGIEIVEDHTISSGVMVETESGIIDATIETRLELLVNEFDQAA
jgi:flagellar assembly protein FliH